MSTPAAERLYLEKQEFLQKVQVGIPRLHAAIDVGWTPSKLANLLADGDFLDLVLTAEAYELDSIEMVLTEKAKFGNMDAIKMVLINRRPDRWADKRQVEVGGSVQIAQVTIDVTRDGLRAMLEEQSSRSAGIAALQPGGVLDEIVEAEVIDDG